MVPIGEVDPRLLQRCLELRDERSVVQGPDHVTLVTGTGLAHESRWPARRPVFEQLGDGSPRVLVHAEDRAGVHARQSQEPEPVAPVLGDGLFVRAHDPPAELIEAKRPEEAAPPQARPAELEVVVVEVEGGRGVVPEQAFLDPLVERCLGARVTVVDGIVAGRGLAELEANEVVRAPLEEGFALDIRDHVVGRADEIAERTRLLLVEPQAVEGDDLRHRAPCSFTRAKRAGGALAGIGKASRSADAVPYSGSVD